MFKNARSNPKNFHKRIKKELCILLYHGVTKVKSRGIENFSRKHLPIDDFLMQMKYISKNCNAISIDDVVEIINNKEDFPPRSVAITFDDSFENIYTNAAPILDGLNIPAVFYITTGLVSSKKMFWVDKLEDCINRTELKKITLPRFNKDFVLKSKKDKIKALVEIKNFCKMNSTKVKDEIVKVLIGKSGIVPNIESSDNYRNITWLQLKNLSKNKLFTIGGHTHTHNILSQISKNDMDFEITHCLNLLRKNLGKEIKHFSYPEGQKDHYNDEVIDKLKNYGVICSPTAITGLNSKNSDPFHLKRIMVGFMGMPFPFYLK